MDLHYTNLNLDDIEGEIWKDIPGYEGFYKCSNKGRIKSMETVGYRGSDIIMKQTLRNDTKYLVVNLYKNTEDRLMRVHIAIGKAFIPNPLNKRTINHKDKVKVNNNLENLEWATHSEQHLHAYANGRKSAMLGVTGERNSCSKPINQLSLDGKIINKFPCAKEAERQLGVNSGHIGSVCKGKRLTTGGYKWEYN